jgi:hypothetical protein
MKPMNDNILSHYKKEFILLAVSALIVRALVFHLYIQPHGYYKQPDSIDYHTAALCMRFGFGMTRPLNNGTCEPLFWRTPGYPAFLAPWYYAYTPAETSFEAAHDAQEHAIWLQVLINALLPVIVFILAYMLTRSYWIAIITAWILVFHLGFVLASSYLLSEGIALIPFYLFVFFVYSALQRNSKHTQPWILNIIMAALMLATYTWIRPMGQFIAVVAMGIILLFDQHQYKERLKKIALFGLLFFFCISPWYIRNYTLTGHWFFCPMFGTYLNSFSAPRAISTAENKPLLETWKLQSRAALMKHQELKPLYVRQGLYCPIEVATAATAWPVIWRYPWYVCVDWVREVLKTAFDLYSNQLVAFVQCSYFYDPLIEYLTEKWQECIYSVPMPLSMRILVYLEVIYALLLWLGLIAGAIQFMLLPLMRRLNVNATIRNLFYTWLSITPLIAAVIVMTGGFGYARLRLPVEGLMIILALTFWQQFFALPTPIQNASIDYKQKKMR